MGSAVVRGAAGALAVLTVMTVSVDLIQGRAAPRQQLPLHLLSVAAALRDVEATLAGEAQQLSKEAAALSGGAARDAGLPRDEGTLSGAAADLSGAAAVSSGTESFWDDHEDRTEDSPLERPPRPAVDSAEFAEYSGRTSRPRRSKKGRRRGGLRLGREEYQFWLRSGECRKTTNGEEQFFCPSPDSSGAWRCTTADTLCDGKRDCPGGEDEHGTACLFYKAISDQLSTVANHVLKLNTHHRAH
ncbi:hypothetical protein FJT64_014443 [Amphibalanus amphitrite]|uniref:Uncharacterized protein n=1 Tax=Amphibalanus amphitrite TaxID=1232801 RepID=A0A6A4V1T7_AMPAM|nr:hypothetical protein FJT64_014443 [Amphibalanus amphitrite]